MVRYMRPSQMDCPGVAPPGTPVDHLVTQPRAASHVRWELASVQLSPGIGWKWK